MNVTFLVTHNPSLSLKTSPQSTQSLLNMSLNLSPSHKTSPTSHADSRIVPFLCLCHLLYSSPSTSDHITQPLLVSCNLSFGSEVNSQKYLKKHRQFDINIPASIIEQLQSKSHIIIQFSTIGVCHEQG